MFSVVFEVCPRQEAFDAYLGLAKRLKPMLESMEGFIDNERFKSTRRPGWLLSHSSWRDEKALVRWRTVGEHHDTQARGRSGIFRDYHLRVGEVTFDSEPPASAPVREQRFDETQVGAAKVLTFTEIAPLRDATIPLEGDRLATLLGLEPLAEGLLDQDVFTSINTPGKAALLASWRDAGCAARWMPAHDSAFASLRHRRVRVVRDYGMYDRAEAPQYFPSVPRP